MSGKWMRFRVPPKTFRLDDRIMQRIGQCVPNRLTGDWESPSARKCPQISVAEPPPLQSSVIKQIAFLTESLVKFLLFFSPHLVRDLIIFTYFTDIKASNTVTVDVTFYVVHIIITKLAKKTYSCKGPPHGEVRSRYWYGWWNCVCGVLEAWIRSVSSQSSICGRQLWTAAATHWVRTTVLSLYGRIRSFVLRILSCLVYWVERKCAVLRGSGDCIFCAHSNQIIYFGQHRP